YLDFIGEILIAFSQISLVLFLTYSFNYIPTDPFIQTPSGLFGYSIIESFVLLGIFSFIVGSGAPIGASHRRLLRAKSLLLIQSSRLEKMRLATLISGLLLIVADFFSMLNSFSHYQQFRDLGLILFVIGFLLFIFGTGQRRSPKAGDVWDSIKKGQMPGFTSVDNYLPKSITEAKQSIQDKVIDTDSQQFYKLNQDIPIIDKGKEKNKFIMKKDSLAVPVSETNDGVTVVLVGESELEEKNQKVTSDTAATTLLIPHQKWQEIYSNLEAFKPSDELIQSLSLKGIESKEKLLSLANKALDSFKSWQGPKALVTEANIQSLLESVQSGKYGVVEEGEYQKVRLPGITVVESPEIQYVNVLGIVKVLEIPALGLNSVNVPFVKVMESRDYQFVSGPGFNVLDTPDGNLVNVFGMSFSEGDKKLVASKILQLAEDQSSMNRLMEGPLEDILNDPNKTLILTETLAGEKKLLMAGKEDAFVEDFALSRKRSMEKHRERREERKQRHKVRTSKRITVNIDTSSHKKREKYLSETKPISLQETQNEVGQVKNHPKTESPKAETKTLLINGESEFPVCKMCNKSVESGGIKCPHCNQYFHKSHYLPWVRDTGQCYNCKNPLNLEFQE
ncbi:MAG: hypothetical protein ACFFD1_10180, partial [Candidatus Thorarchaeota archaeon]